MTSAAVTPLHAAPQRRLGGPLATVLLWSLGAVLLGAGLGLAAGADQLQAAGLLMLLPAAVWLVLRPEWLPVFLVVTVFAEAATFGGLTVSRLAGPLALGVLLLQLGRGRPFQLPDRRLLWALLAFSLWSFASALWTVNFDATLQPGGTGFGIASLALTIMYFLAVLYFVRTEQDIRRVVTAIWAVSVVMGFVAIGEFASGQGRALGVSGDANFFASLQIVAVPLGAALASQTRRAGPRIVLLLGVAVIVGSIFTTLSRGGILSLAALFLLLAIQPARSFFRTRARKRAFLFVAAAGAALLLVMSYSALSERTSSMFNSDDRGSGRGNLWLAAQTGFEENPVRGMGFGAFASQSNTLMRRTPGVSFNAYRLEPNGQPVHNLYLEALVETGVIGFALLMIVLVTCVLTFRRAARAATTRGSPFLSSMARAGMLAFIGFAFASLFLSTATDRTLWVLFALALALPRVIAAYPADTKAQNT